MEANLGQRQKNDYARFKAPLLNDLQCMTFYYHIYGHGGTLNVYMALGDNLGVPLWTRTGSQGDVWRFGRTAVSKSNANVVFEGNIQNLTNQFNLFLCLKLLLDQMRLVAYLSTMLFLPQVHARKALLLADLVHLSIIINVALHRMLLFHHLCGKHIQAVLVHYVQHQFLTIIQLVQIVDPMFISI